MATEVTYRDIHRVHRWPGVQLNLWIFVILAAASTTLGIFAWFIVVQNQLRVGVPWLFPFGIVTSSLTILFLILILILAAQKQLNPGIVLLLSFILFVLWLTTLIETSIQLFGAAGNVNSNCNTYVTGQEYHGISIETLAWLTQSNICSCWKAVFSWSLIATILFLWMQILSWQVQNDSYA